MGIFGLFGKKKDQPARDEGESLEDMFRVGMEAYRAGKYGKAASYLERCAKRGDTESMFICGDIYGLGQGVRVDMKKALYYYEQGLMRDDSRAETHLDCADIYRGAGGMEPDLDKSLEHYKKAAELGNHDAMFRGAELCLETRNYRESLHFYILAAKTGDTNAMYNCGAVCHAVKNLDASDYKEGALWLHQAASLGHEKAQELLDSDPGWTWLRAAEAAREAGDNEEALPLMEKAAEEGLAEAVEQCAEMYFYGEAAGGDDEKALYWYEKAAERGNAQAMSLCAEAYTEGSGVPKDPAKGLYWHEKAAEQGDSYSQWMCCRMYYEGEGCDVDYVKALHWGLMAIESNSPSDISDVFFYCARIYHQGLGTARDTAKAAELYDNVNDENREQAMLLRAEIFYNGDGVPVDKAEALRSYSEAAKEGSEDALRKCGSMYSRGEGTDSDCPPGFEKLMEGARQGDVEAAGICGCLYIACKAPERDFRNAASLLNRAAGEGSRLATEVLNRLVDITDDDTLCDAGAVLKKRGYYAPALHMLTTAAEHGHTEAKIELASMYWNGEGVEQDLHRALDLEEEAADAGSEEALDHIWKLRTLLGEM